MNTLIWLLIIWLFGISIAVCWIIYEMGNNVSEIKTLGGFGGYD